jgi:hypothetical protein
MNVAPALRMSGGLYATGHELRVCGDGNQRRTSEGQGNASRSNRRRRVFDEHRQLRLSFCELRFGPLALADFDEHADGAGQFPGRIEQRRRMVMKGRVVGRSATASMPRIGRPDAVPSPLGTAGGSGVPSANRASRNRRTSSRRAGLATAASL